MKPLYDINGNLFEIDDIVLFAVNDKDISELYIGKVEFEISSFTVTCPIMKLKLDENICKKFEVIAKDSKKASKLYQKYEEQFRRLIRNDSSDVTELKSLVPTYLDKFIATQK